MNEITFESLTELECKRVDRLRTKIEDGTITDYETEMLIEILTKLEYNLPIYLKNMNEYYEELKVYNVNLREYIAQKN